MRSSVSWGLPVRQLRTLHGWSQATLATRAGLSQGAISRLEGGYCHALPFHSVIAVLRALTVQRSLFGLPVKPAVDSLLSFADQFDGSVVTPPDTTIYRLLTLYHRLPGDCREAILAFLESMESLSSNKVSSNDNP